MTSKKTQELIPNTPELNKNNEIPNNAEKGITKEVVTDTTAVKNEILASNISPGQLFESERKTGNVMKKFIKPLGENKFEADFSNNSQAEHNIGLADLFGEEVRKIKVTGEKNGIKYDMTGERQGLKGGFYENGKYVPVFNNFKIEILESFDKKELSKQKEQNENKVNEILKSPFVEKFKNKYSSEQLEIIVRKSQEYGIDPCLLLAMRSTENGRVGLDFGVMNPSMDTFDGQLTMACRIIQHNINKYKRITGNDAADGENKLSPEFLGFLSNIYAPIGANNDSNNLNSNHFRNLLAFYGEYSGKQFENIDEIVNNNYAFLKKWEVQITSGQIIGSTTGDDLIANANVHLGKGYVWGQGRGDTTVTDCSGLVLMAMKESGVVDNGYNNTAAGLSKITKQKSPKDVLRGDLVFLQKGGEITHVEIATGPANNGVIPIIDSASKIGVSNRFQTIDESVLVGTPIFYKS